MGGLEVVGCRCCVVEVLHDGIVPIVFVHYILPSVTTDLTCHATLSP